MTTPYFVELQKRTKDMGGFFNAHLHLDRAGTYEATLHLLEGTRTSASSLSLSKKHALIPLIHSSNCYEPDQLEARVADCLQELIGAGTTRADTVVDVTADRVGLDALKRCLRLKTLQRKYIDFRVGAYSPLGFRDDEPERMELLEAGAILADFIGALPERDDQSDYPEHIGFEESCRRILQLSSRLRKPVHLHVDQKNYADEEGAECVIRLVREMNLGVPTGEEPTIWLVHVISPSAYKDSRFIELVNGLAELNIGIICCPSAAISMRQLRTVDSPTRNCIARVLEFLAAGIHVRIGSDNVCDITSPAGTFNLVDELFVLCNTLRYYDLEILSKLGAGVLLNQEERHRIKDHLAKDSEDVTRTIRKLETSKTNWNNDHL